MSLVQHRLSLCVRFMDHFSGLPVADEFPVRLSSGHQRPVLRSDRAGHRHADGTYRFLDALAGDQHILWRDPFQRTHNGWTRWDLDNPAVSLPSASPTQKVDIELWPTAEAVTKPNATGVRGKLEGANVSGLEVQIALQSEPFVRLTRTDQAGEFLFLPPGSLPLNAAGRIPFKIQVRTPGGPVRMVTGGRFQPTAAGADFIGTSFSTLPQIVTRTIFQLA
jgi:hypothetical protein